MRDRCLKAATVPYSIYYLHGNLHQTRDYFYFLEVFLSLSLFFSISFSPKHVAFKRSELRRSHNDASVSFIDFRGADRIH